ncbi:OLC1v1001081C1 [Oldenlandia corymbosa var. corymbosa]|uniref:OLC1v1001081C1 n=1 Tax=Oldenlandia corymbosa var. corymbosa TaxID=529605 RepID=A0AAV1D4D8_OLDCO|nr:OLC1v1001081C1 [Oldenlandia corymbosa var. corymbosa]
MDSVSAAMSREPKDQGELLKHAKIEDEEDLEFSWGRKRCVGGPDGSVQFYDSFTFDGVEYFLFDCVYLWCDDHPEPYIGKLVKIWETANRKRKVKVVWFFRPSEVQHWLGDMKPSENELFLASGEGKGLFNLNPLETICGKCNVVCTSKDPRNPQPTAVDLSKADYLFYRTFDVQSCKISNNFANEIAGVEVIHYFNSRKVQNSTSVAENRIAMKVPNRNISGRVIPPEKDGSSARCKRNYPSLSSRAGGADIQAPKKKKLQVSSEIRRAKPLSNAGNKESLVNSRDTGRNNRSPAKGITVNENARNGTYQHGQNKVVQSFRPTLDIKRRQNTDSSKWFKQLQSWEDRMREADAKGTLVLLENLDPSYTSTELEEILLHAFNQQVGAKMIKHALFNNSNHGKAFVIFKSKDAADSSICSLEKRSLMLGDQGPIVGRRIQLGDCGNPPKFFGHLYILKLHRMLKQNADKKNAVSTAHFCQGNTIEHDLAMEWFALQERSELQWKALHEAQAKEMEDLKRQNTTTCRVESAHKALKNWIDSPTDAIDTIWGKAHNEIEVQLIEIRRTLEESRNKNGIPYRGYPFYHLNSVVSHHYLQKLHKKYEEMQIKGNNFVCDHKLRSTHDIPCGCEMKITVDAGPAIQVSDLNPFWANLNIDESPVNSRLDGLSDDQVLWKHLVGVVENGDPLVMRRTNGWLYDQIYPDRGPSKQPKKKKKGKGRRKGSKNKPHKQVYIQWDFRQSDGPPQDVVQQNIYEYANLERIAPCMIPYISGYVDVLGDGNCGFRVMASHLFGSEHQWHNSRRIGADELEERPDLYDFFFKRDIPKHVHRIRWRGVRGQNMNISSSTILPLIAPRGPNGPLTEPVQEIVIAHLGDYKHYIRLDFLGSNFPVPSIPYQWFRHRDTSIIGWEQPYLKRIELWHTLCPDNGRTQSSHSSPFNVD